MRVIQRIHVRGAVAAIIAMLVCQGGASHADNESDRKRYLGEIEARLASATSELSGFESDSDDGDLNDAAGHVREVASLVDALDDVKDDDGVAREIVARYPRHVDDWQRAAAALRELKRKQAVAPGYLRSCTAWDEALRERARTSKDDPRAAEDLSTFAKSVGRQAQELVAEAERLRDQLEDAAEEVARFSADQNNWRGLRDATRGAAESIWRRWDREVADARRACEEVAKGERHRDVEAALGRLASSKAGRAELRGKLDTMLGLIADRIDGAASHTDASRVNGAVELTREVGSLLERLRSAQGDDDAIRKLASEWPAWNDELRGSLEALRAMKEDQRGADAGEARCLALERELQEQIKTVLATPTRHKDGASELLGAAARLGNEWLPKLAKADEGDRRMQEGHERARRFSRSDPPWGAIRDRLHASADAIRNHWNERYRAARKQCELLALGTAHPDVKSAVAELGKNVAAMSDSSKALYAELNQWDADIGALRDFTSRDMAEIRAALCAAPDAGEYEEAIAVADRWASQLTAQYGTILGRAERLKQAADALAAKGRSRTRMDNVKRRVDETLASLAKVKDHQLQGANNPLFKTYTAYGVNKHAELQGGCDAKEIAITDTCSNPHPRRKDCRIDCMRGCTVVEIKPLSQRSLGDDQARAYLQGLERKFAAKGMDMFKENGLDYFRQCLTSDRTALDLDWRVDTYEFCEGFTPDKGAAPVTDPDFTELSGDE